MQNASKTKIAFRVIQFTLVVFGAYISVSLFGLWAHLPFWIKDIALAAVIVSIYLYARNRAKIYKKLKHYLSPAELKLLGLRPAWWLHSLTVIVVAGLTFNFFYTESGIPGRILQAMTFSLKQPPGEVLLTLVVTPPSYLGRGETVVLSEKDGPFTNYIGNERLSFPEGSILDVEIKNTRDYSPYVSLGNALGQNYREGDLIFHSRHVLSEAATLDIRVGPYISIKQAFAVIPDESPKLTSVSIPQVTKRNSLELKYAYWDDHGVDKVVLEMSRRGLTGTETDTIALPALEASDGEALQTYYTNLLSHPWAGSSVTVAIKVIDDLGQVNASEPVILLLPELSFRNPVAQDLNSIRKALLITPERKSAQVQRLNTLTNNQGTFHHNASIYLALRSAYWKLRSAETARDFEEVTRYLWQTALRLEDNGSFEEQGVQAIMDQMVGLLAEDRNPVEFDNLAGNLQGRMDVMYDTEFMLISRRLSLNDNDGRMEMPGFASFKTLIATMRDQVNRGDKEAALKTLIAFRALFEQRPVPVF